MRLSVVIVSWNVRQYVMDCLRSLAEHPTREAFEIIVIDNASTDGTVDRVRQGFPWVAVVANAENRGFAAASNQGVARSRGQYILFLNPDTMVHPSSLDTLIAFMEENPDAGACSPRLLNADGTTQPSVRGFPTFGATLYQSTVFRHTGLFRGAYRRWMMKDFAGNTKADVDIPKGAALMVRRSTLDEIGGMDERFFMYYEEADLCYRLKRAGWRIVFVPDALITHLGGRSSSQVPVAMRIMMLSSLLQYFRKHRGPIVTGLFNCLFKPAVIAREICDFLAGSVAYAASVVAGNGVRRRKSAAKVRNSAVLLGKYSWWLLFRA